MLAQRVLTAIVLLAVLGGALLAPGPWPLAAVLTVAAACALWEWLRLSWPAAHSRAPVVISAAAAVLMAGLLGHRLGLAQWQPLDLVHDGLRNPLLPVVAALWIFGATAVVVRGRLPGRPADVFLSAFALAAVPVAWLSLLDLFLGHGAWCLISLLALIWCADIAAYFTGKAFGRRKLAPAISPGKTWEGAVGGIAAGTLWVAASAGWPGSFGAALRHEFPWWAVLLIAALLSALSIVGDLFESLLKRRAGVKDSSQLLPGHGGVYDRIDALLPVAPVALLLIGASPQ